MRLQSRACQLFWACECCPNSSVLIRLIGSTDRLRLARLESCRHQEVKFILMSLRYLPRTLKTRPRPIYPTRIYTNQYHRPQRQFHSTGTTEAKENPTSSAEHVATSESASPKQVPLTAESHRTIKQDPNLAKQVKPSKLLLI